MAHFARQEGVYANPVPRLTDPEAKAYVTTGLLAINVIVFLAMTFSGASPLDPTAADLRRFGDQTPPDGPILAVRVEDLAGKEAVLAAHPAAFFTIPHFGGFAAVLIQLPVVADGDLAEAITDGWLAMAPPALARQYLDG